MQVPDLRTKNDRIELDQISILLNYIHILFKDGLGEAPDPNDWDSMRIRKEFEEIFSPEEFTRLFQTEFGRGVLIGAWVNRFIMGVEDEDTEMFDN